MALLSPLPDGVQITSALTANLPFIHIFTTSQAELIQTLPQLKAALAKTGMLWVSWPKKSAKVPTDLSSNIVRERGLATGLVDVKVAAIDDIWSGLKFVYRVTDR